MQWKYIENWEIVFWVTSEFFIDFEFPTLKLYTLEFIREDAFINLQQIDNLKLSFYSTWGAKMPPILAHVEEDPTAVLLISVGYISDV